MKHPVIITEKKKNGAIEIIVDSKYYNDNQIYREPTK